MSWNLPVLDLDALGTKRKGNQQLDGLGRV